MTDLRRMALPLAIVLTAGPLSAAAPVFAAGTAADSTNHRSLAGRTAAKAAQNSPHVLHEIVAVVNKSPITRDQVDAELERNYADKVIFALILTRLLDQAAEKKHMVPTHEELVKAYADADREAHGQLATILATHKMSRTQFEAAVLKPRMEMESLAKPTAAPTEADVMKYYAAHKMDWSAPSQVDLSRMHVPSLDAANQAVAQLNGGKEWGDVFAQFSDDKDYYKTSKGEYGKVVRSLLPQEVSAAIADLKPGQISKPMPIPEEGPDKGFVIWKVNAITAGQAPPYAEKKAEIRRILTQQGARKSEEVIHDLVVNADIEGLDPQYQQLFEQFRNPPPPRSGMPEGMVPPQPPADGQ